MKPKQIIGGLIGVVGIGYAAYRLANGKGMEPMKYSNRWIKALSDKDWEEVDIPFKKNSPSWSA